MGNGHLFRQGLNGTEQAANPLRKAMDVALSVRNAIADRLQGGAFVISVLLFPDMEENDEVRRWAQDSRPNVVFGVDSLVQRLTELDDVQEFATVPGLPDRVGGRRPDARGAAGGQPGLLHAQGLAHGPTAQHVEIHNLVVNLHTAPGPVPFVQQATAGAEEGDADVENQD